MNWLAVSGFAGSGTALPQPTRSSWPIRIEPTPHPSIQQTIVHNNVARASVNITALEAESNEEGAKRRTAEIVDRVRGILAIHKGHEATVAIASLLFVGAWPHDLDARDRSELAELGEQHGLGRERVEVADVEVGGARVAVVERASFAESRSARTAIAATSHVATASTTRSSSICIQDRRHICM